MSATSQHRLIDYVLLVGPSTRLPDHEAGDCEPSSGSWERIFKPQPAILRRYPSTDHPNQPLGEDVAYFCQPEGCHYEVEDPITHLFMLTHTETNTHTYGVCISFPCLVDPVSRAQSRNWEYQNQDSVSIQEWGVLSLCILSRENFFVFFEKCLRTIIHFVEHFCGDRLSWDLLIHYQFLPSLAGKEDRSGPIRELEQWISRLLCLPVPRAGEEVLEVELEVDPAQLLGCPDSTRLSLADFPVHELFHLLGAETAIEVYKLLLMEQKIVLHSKSYSLAAQCVFTLLTILYPLQYLFPVIPLLPSCMPAAENLLMAPTPYFFGVSSSFLKKINSDMKMEIWLVDVDKGKIMPPLLEDLHYQPHFPLSLHQLQADITHATDMLTKPSIKVATHSVSNTSSDASPVVTDDEIDVMIRIAFLEFLTGGEMIGCIGNHLTIYRLFPRPVVALKSVSFLKQYLVNKGKEEKDFIKYFIRSQSVEYYLEWCLNPNNTTFEEVQRGINDIERLGDKLVWWQKRTKPILLQETIYSPDQEPLLYQEMLRYKASQASHGERFHESDDSDFEIIGQGYYGERESLCIEDDNSSSSSSSSRVSAAGATQVTVELHPPSASSNGDTQTFLSLQPSLNPTVHVHQRLTPPSKLPIEKTPSPPRNTTVFHSPVSLTPAPVSTHGKMANGSSTSPQPYFTPQAHTSAVHHSSVYPMASLTDRLFASPASSPSVSPIDKGGGMFRTPSTGLGPSEGDKAGGLSRNVPWTAVSSVYEQDIKELVTRISSGQGLPWPKPLVFKKIISEERSRVALLRQLELRLKLREQNEMVQSVREEIRPVVVSRAVYRGLLELLRLILNQIEKEILNNQESVVFSAFLIFRLALSLCMETRARAQSSLPTAPTSEVNSTPTKEGEVHIGASAVSWNRSQECISPVNSRLSPTPPIRRVRAISSPVPMLKESEEEEEEMKEMKEYVYLHSDLMKGLGTGRNFMLQRSFWTNLFVCVVDSDRGYLGWNENTSELYSRYNSLPATCRNTFGYAEDALISIALHNLLVFMLMVGMSTDESLDLCQRLSAKTRLATVEEKLLQQTMQELEDSTGTVELRSLVVLPLYSETQSLVTYVVHHGVSVTCPVYKLQVTSEVCILRRFPDEKITRRYWFDKMSTLSIFKERMTLSFEYQEDLEGGRANEGEGKKYFHHFHSKQYLEIFRCLQQRLHQF